MQSIFAFFALFREQAHEVEQRGIEKMRWPNMHERPEHLVAAPRMVRLPAVQHLLDLPRENSLSSV